MAVEDEDIFLLRFCKIFLEFLIVLLREEYLFPALTATSRHMVEGPIIFTP